ncbi:RsmF rRNA methyltransferase first C-terminal domain-containing protein [Anaerotignum sp.]
MNLPLEYTEKMKALLGEEYEEYLASFDEGRFYGLRANTLKISPEQLQETGVFRLSPVAWCPEGFYYEGEERPAKHPYYHAGLYYLQEPSAMSPATTLPIQKGDFVLDLCAAPGGKTTQLGARLQGTGLLVANDISAGRAKTLLKNVELAGIRNAIVMSETPEHLAERLPAFFDKILVDAPCSGEGMFRKEPDMVKSWDGEMLAFCRTEQAKILEACAPMLKAGGMLLYSTCTFSPEENEKSIGDFLEHHPEFELVPMEKKHGFASGLPPYEACARLYPHKLKGEGHFLALLQKKESEGGKMIPAEEGKWIKQMEPFREFAKDVLQEMPKGIYQIFGDGLYLLPEGTPKLEKLRVLRTGWMLGTLKKDRFEPAQAFAMGLRKEEVKNVVDFPLEDDRVIRYLKGETVEGEGKDGWTLVCVDGFPLGWAKLQKGRLKNKYAVSWKWE